MSKLAEIRDEIEARLSHIDYAYGIKTAEEARQRHETNATLLFDVLDLLAIAAAAGAVVEGKSLLVVGRAACVKTNREHDFDLTIDALYALATALAKLEGEAQ